MKRILFVDDEQHILDALRALLRPKRALWDMVFVTRAQDAVQELAQAPVDVLVSDMRMPGMDGAALLAHARQHHPEVVRIVLSGFAEMETALRTVPVAHHFLLKPANPDVLENVVERACQLQDVLREVERIEGPLDSDNPEHLPQLYLDLIEVVADEKSGASKIAEVVQTDEHVSGTVLHLANSPLLGLGREMRSVEAVVRLLGTNMIKNLTLAALVYPNRGDASTVHSIHDHRERQHGLLVGGVARRLVAADARLAEDSFIAGILHDIGKTVMGRASSSAAGESPGDAARPTHHVEYEEHGFSHAEVGGRLLHAWGLPYPIIEAVTNHHRPDRVRHLGVDASTAVSVANVLVHEEAARCGDPKPFDAIEDELVRLLGISDCLPEWRQLARSFLEAPRGQHWLSGDPPRRRAVSGG